MHIPKLPPKVGLETVEILKQVSFANKELAMLKGFAQAIPNDTILLNSIMLIEAKDSSEIENIITTQDKLFSAIGLKVGTVDPATKEVLNYRSAMWKGYESMKKRDLLTINVILDVQKELELNNAGIRSLPGTVIINQKTGEVLHRPPEGKEVILDLLSNLEQYINEDVDDIDPLIKLAVLHYQFETIHPFYDGNGRTGRILNILYLIMKGLLDSPVLYLSNYIINNKAAYYQGLKDITEKEDWHSWILYILTAIGETAKSTVRTIEGIRKLLDGTIKKVQDELPKVYSKNLIELLFINPYTKISFLVDAGIAERRTASKYLKELEGIGVLNSQKKSNVVYYINHKLVNFLKARY